jgi:hypothetical protein
VHFRAGSLTADPLGGRVDPTSQNPLAIIIAQLPQFQPWWQDYQHQDWYDPANHRAHLSDFTQLLLDSANNRLIPDFESVGPAIEQALLATLRKTPSQRDGFADERYDEIGLSIIEQLIWAVEDGLIDGSPIYAALGEFGRQQWNDLWRYQTGKTWANATA